MGKIQPKILAVDDDLSIRELLQTALASIGEIDTAENAQEAREKFYGEEYSAVLLDYRLPDTDGLALLKEFKELQPHTEIVMLTHVRDVKLAVQAIKLGAFDYINKDFDIDELRNLLQRMYLPSMHRSLVAILVPAMGP